VQRRLLRCESRLASHLDAPVSHGEIDEPGTGSQGAPEGVGPGDGVLEFETGEDDGPVSHLGLELGRDLPLQGEDRRPISDGRDYLPTHREEDGSIQIPVAHHDTGAPHHPPEDRVPVPYLHFDVGPDVLHDHAAVAEDPGHQE
jgi:hypothetical protein